MTKKVKIIYKRKWVVTSPCMWCEQTGIDPVWGGLCSTCKGRGGSGKWVNVEVGREVTDVKG